MKFTIDRKTFANALKAAAAIIPARSPKPILSCVHLSADATGVTIRATDLELELVQRVEVLEGSDEGVAVVPAAILAQIVGASTDGVIAIEHDDKVGMTITSSDGSFKLFGYPAADYPAMSTNDAAHSYAVQAGQLAEAISQTIYATARENSRYAINGVMLAQAGQSIELIATDGHRLALATMQAAQPAKVKKTAAIVPTRALAQFGRLFDDAAGMVNVTVEAGRIVFADDNISLSSSLVDGNFPPHKDVIPKNQPIAIVVDREAMLSAVKRAAMLTNEESKGIKLEISTPGGITITSRAPESGEAEITLPIVNYHNTAAQNSTIAIGFNPFYVLDVLKSTRAENITLGLTAGNKPGTIAAPGVLAVVMPINLQ